MVNIVFRENSMSTKEISAAVSEAVAGEMTGKKWYFSKTFWTNVVMALAVNLNMVLR